MRVPSAWSRAAGTATSTAAALRGRTRAGRRQARDERLLAYRAFGDEHGWPVRGLVENLTQRFPVPPLLGATAAQAELALTGTWAGRPALVTSVLVRPYGADPRDVVVQLTALDLGGAARLPEDVSGLRPGDQLGSVAGDLVHTRVLAPGDGRPDVAGPLRLLADLAARLG